MRSPSSLEIEALSFEACAGERGRHDSGRTPHRVEQRIAFVMSGGTEGVLSPHITVFTRDDAGKRGSEDVSGKRLSIGMAHTRDFSPEEIGRGVQIRETARAVAAAMAEAAIVDPHDVHFVQIKCPLLTSDRVEAAAARGNKTVTTSAYGSMAYSRGASALGVAVALGEIEGEIDDEHVLLKEAEAFLKKDDPAGLGIASYKPVALMLVAVSKYLKDADQDPKLDFERRLSALDIGTTSGAQLSVNVPALDGSTSPIRIVQWSFDQFDSYACQNLSDKERRTVLEISQRTKIKLNARPGVNAC